MLFGKKEEKKNEVQAEVKPVESKQEAKPATKVIYKILDTTGRGDWTVVKQEVAREKELDASEFKNLLFAMRAVADDVNARIKHLKGVRSAVKKLRKEGVPMKAVIRN